MRTQKNRIAPDRKGTTGASEGSLKPPGPSRQIAFHQLLVAARKKILIDALSDALSSVDPRKIKAQIAEYVPADVQKILAASGVRDEYVFPVPAVIEVRPTLIGYYRLLIAPQKSFYKGSTGMGCFKSMEETGACSEKQLARLHDYCHAMSGPLAELVRQIPSFTDRDLRELPLLTFRMQLQGSNNTQIGKRAMQDVFVAITEILTGFIVKKEPSRLTVRNSAGRTVYLNLSHDPDVSIQEQVAHTVHNKVAIEVKGGTDISNAHNRAGEAEKSHLKARQQGFQDFWTIISKAGLDLAKLARESQTTTEWFDVTELLARQGKDWQTFRQRLAGAVGIPL